MEATDKRFLMRIAVSCLAIIIVLVMAKVLFFRAGSGNAPPPAASRVTTPAAPGAGAPAGTKVISWQNARNHYGETCIVEGTIVATHNSGKACFLNFHPDYKNHFTAVIFANRFGQFPPSPESYYRGKKVRVSGYVKEYQGKPEIILESLSQIEIVGE